MHAVLDSSSEIRFSTELAADALKIKAEKLNCWHAHVTSSVLA